MRIFYLTSLLALLSGGTVLAGTAHHWPLKEGEGHRIVKDTVGGLDGKLVGKVDWAREDDRGWFLTFDGGTVEVKPSAELNYPEGLIAEIHFSPNLAAGDKPWTCLFSRGSNYKRGWTVMLERDGSSILIGLAGVKPSYKTVGVKLESNREYRLALAVGDGKVRLAVDGKCVAEYPVSGAPAETPDKFYLGGNLQYPFAGNVYDFQVAPYSKEAADKVIPAGKAAAPIPVKPEQPRKISYPALNLPNPEGTVTVSDFNAFSPKPDPAVNGWNFRDNAHFIAPFAGVLHPASAAGSTTLEYDPGLTGEYDLYAGVRTYTNPTAMIIAAGDEYFRISLPGTGPRTHYNIEQLIARKIDMTGKKVKLQSVGQGFSLGYLKWIPSGRPRAKDYPPFPGAKVEKTTPATAESVEKSFEEKIARQIADGHFTPCSYVEKKSMPQITEESRKRGYILFTRNWMDLVWPNTVPARDSGTIVLKTAAARGETVPTAFALHALRDLERVTVKQLTAFTAAGGGKADLKTQISVVESARKRTTDYSRKSEFMEMPYYLEPIRDQKIKQGVSREFFLTFTVPEDALPGEYSAEFAVEADGQSMTVPVRLTVYPFVLAEVKDLYFGFWTPLTAAPEDIRKTIAEQALSANSIVAASSVLLRVKGDRADNFTIDWDRSALVTLGREMKKRKMNGRIYLMTQYLYLKCNELPPADREAAYTKAIREIMEKARAEAWPEIVFNSFDEVLSVPDKLPAFISEVKLQKKAGGKTADDHIWFKTARPYQKEVDEISPWIDIFIVRFNTRNLWYVDSWQTMLRTAREKNVELIAYNSNNALTCSQPAAMRFVNGWFQRSPLGDGCRGQLIWTWFHSSGSPLDDLDGTDWTYIVPPYKDRKGGPTFDLLGLRAGYSDIRYILTLEQAVTEAKAAGKDVSRAEKLLSDLRGSFDCRTFLEQSIYFNSRWSEKFEQDGKRCVSGVLNLPNGWSLDDYDVNRAKIAEAIQTLQK